MTHADLVEKAARWLRSKGCKIVLTEFTSACTETPDAIGWKGAVSYLVECKTSRSDFHADKRKAFRRRPSVGVGRFRYYLAPKGVLAPDDLPERWGLLEPHGRGLTVVVGHDPYSWDAGGFNFREDEFNVYNEIRMLTSGLNRLRIRLGQQQFDQLINESYLRHRTAVEENGGERADVVLDAAEKGESNEG